jgi:hypothetical protein
MPPGDVAEFARWIARQGFNVVCVGRDKRPLGSWSASGPKHSPEDCAGADAVAVTGNYFADGRYRVVGIDCDDLAACDRMLSEAIGPDWRQHLCGQPWSFCVLTGPRPKGRVRCEGDRCVIYEDAAMTKPLREVPAGEVERGLAIIARVPAGCVKRDFGTVRGSGVEIIYNNYQIVYGLHPSGLSYQPARWAGQWEPVERPGAGEILTCEELHRLVAAVRGGGEGGGDGQERPPAPPQAWDREVARPAELAALLKRWWPLTGEDGNHFHDWLTFGITSLAWRYGIKKESIAAVFEEVFRWALEQGLDTERNVEHHRSVIEWVYSAGPDRRRWGGRKLREVLGDVLKAERGESPTELEVEEVLSAVFRALGVKERRPEDVVEGILCVPVRWVTDGRDSALAAEWLCNTREGILVRRAMRKGRRRGKKRGGGGGEGKEGEGAGEGGGPAALFEELLLVDASILSLTVYGDVLTGREYVSAEVAVGKSGWMSWQMRPRNSFVEGLEAAALVRSSPRWRAIVNYYPHVRDIIVSGFACPNPDDPRFRGLPCSVRDYFRTGIRDPDKHSARQALDALLGVLDRFAPSSAWYKTAVTAYFHALAQALVLTRKLWGVRPMFAVFEGPKGAGKTTVATLAVQSLFPERAHELVVPVSGTISAARLGRLQDEIITTVAVLDEQKGSLQKSEVLDTLKSMVTHTIAWKTAWGERWPAAAGFVITANVLALADPELADKLYKIQFPARADESRRPEFAAALTALAPRLGDIGGYYLHYLEREWQQVRDAALAPTQPEAAERAARLVADDLGVALELVPARELSAAPAAVTAVELLRETVWRELKQQLPPVRLDGNIDARTALRELVDKRRVPFMRPFVNGRVMITRDVERAAGVNIRTLCEELGGEVHTRSHKRELYGGCVASWERLEEALFGPPEGREEEEGPEGGGGDAR